MRRQSEIAALVTEETGGTLGWGGFDVQLAAGMLAYYAGQALRGGGGGAGDPVADPR